MATIPFPPFTPGAHHVPDYYRAAFDTEHIRTGADVIELWEAWGIERPCIATAIKYLIRAGRKPGEAAAKDLTKACEVIQRELSAVVREPQRCGEFRVGDRVDYYSQRDGEVRVGTVVGWNRETGNVTVEHDERRESVPWVHATKLGSQEP